MTSTFSNHNTRHQIKHRLPAPTYSCIIWFYTFCCLCLMISGHSITSKLGITMDRSPESTIAPLRDEVLFVCDLNLTPDRFEWRFKPQSSRGEQEVYSYLTRNVRSYN